MKNDLDLLSVLNLLNQQARLENLVFVKGKGQRKKTIATGYRKTRRISSQK